MPPGYTEWPVPGYTVELRDPDGVRVADGETGELDVRGPPCVLMYCTIARDEDPERYLLAFVYGYLGDHDLLRVRTDAEKYLLLAAINLVECLADVESARSQ